MNEKTKHDCLRRLSRIEGQVRGVAAMVDGDRYCIDIINQIAAVQSALRKVEEVLLQNHVSHCIENAIATGNAEDQRTKVAELITVLRRPQRWAEIYLLHGAGDDENVWVERGSIQARADRLIAAKAIPRNDTPY